jgi:two-component system CheB/CheR fusion protein
LDGLQVTAKIREKLYRQVPVIILTGDISTATLRDIARENCVRLNKPVKLNELTQTIQRLLPTPKHSAPASMQPHPESIPGKTVIYVVDDDSHIRDGMRGMLEGDGRVVKSYATAEEFLEHYRPGNGGCLLVDAYLPGMNGLELLQRLDGSGHRLPAIMITGYGDVPMAVRAMKAGALDFIEKPITRADLLASVERALDRSRDASKLSAWRQDAANHLAGLTSRQHQIMDLVLAGQPNKIIAADLHISQRTVENHRAAIMKKTGSKSLPALARLALAADWNGPEAPPASRTTIQPAGSP